jgi:hypothetical protein
MGSNIMEKFQTKDGNVIIYDRGRAEVINPKELEKEKEAIEIRIQPPPNDKVLLQWARDNYPRVNHEREIRELEGINEKLSLVGSR